MEKQSVPMAITAFDLKSYLAEKMAKSEPEDEITKSYQALKRLWIQRCRYQPYSRRWVRLDKRCNKHIEKTTEKLVRFGCYTPEWHLRLWWQFLEQMP